MTLLSNEIRLEWEIILLKEALVLSNENCEMLFREFCDILYDLEIQQKPDSFSIKARVEELLVKTESLKKSNYLLVKTMTENHV